MKKSAMNNSYPNKRTSTQTSEQKPTPGEIDPGTAEIWGAVKIMTGKTSRAED
jgi:hypothetical protein